MMCEGVPLNELRCPTCGDPILDYWLYTEFEEEFSLSQIVSDIKVVPVSRRYLRCPEGHKWTVKYLWRARGFPDYVLLGEYLGQAQ